MRDVAVRALQPADADAARALVSAQFSGTLYQARLLEQLQIAIGGEDPECRAMVAIAADERVLGVALFGQVAGAQGVVKLHALAGDDRDALGALVVGVHVSGARMVVCEIADDAPFRVTVEVLLELGYEEAGRVADLVRDGVALLILTWRSQ